MTLMTIADGGLTPTYMVHGVMVHGVTVHVAVYVGTAILATYFGSLMVLDMV